MKKKNLETSIRDLSRREALFVLGGGSIFGLSALGAHISNKNKKWNLLEARFIEKFGVAPKFGGFQVEDEIDCAGLPILEKPVTKAVKSAYRGTPLPKSKRHQALQSLWNSMERYPPDAFREKSSLERIHIAESIIETTTNNVTCGVSRAVQGLFNDQTPEAIYLEHDYSGLDQFFSHEHHHHLETQFPGPELEDEVWQSEHYKKVGIETHQVNDDNEVRPEFFTEYSMFSEREARAVLASVLLTVPNFVRDRIDESTKVDPAAGEILMNKTQRIKDFYARVYPGQMDGQFWDDVAVEKPINAAYWAGRATRVNAAEVLIKH